MALLLIKLERIAKITQLQVSRIFVEKNIRSFEISMDHVVCVQIVQSLQDLVNVGSRYAFPDSTKLPADVCDTATWHVLEVDTEHIVVNDLATQVLHNVFAV